MMKSSQAPWKGRPNKVILSCVALYEAGMIRKITYHLTVPNPNDVSRGMRIHMIVVSGTHRIHYHTNLFLSFCQSINHELCIVQWCFSVEDGAASDDDIRLHAGHVRDVVVRDAAIDADENIFICVTHHLS